MLSWVEFLIRELRVNPAENQGVHWTERTWNNILIGGLALGALGLVLPWVSAGFLSASGLDTGDGKVYGALLLVAILLTVIWRRRRTRSLGYLALITALLMSAVAVYDVVHVSVTHGPLGISYSPGMGLLIDTAAGLGIAMATWKILRWPSSMKEEEVVSDEPRPTRE